MYRILDNLTYNVAVYELDEFVLESTEIICRYYFPTHMILNVSLLQIVTGFRCIQNDFIHNHLVRNEVFPHIF